MARNTTGVLKIKSGNLFPVVGIGASAGGLDAFKRLLKAIPPQSGMAYILVQHLDPAHDSILAELLQKVTPLPVREITDNMLVNPDNVYIIPSNKLLTANDGVLQLIARVPNQKYMPIDLFFQSLAEVHQDHAIGVVLSGSQSDGTLGLKAIKEQGGITFAQDPLTADYDSMPQNAIDAGVVDFILEPGEIPGQLLTVHHIKDQATATESGDFRVVQEIAYKEILSLLRKHKGVDFTSYRQNTIRRRIDRRISLSRKGGLAEYYQFMLENRGEQDVLYQDLLIPVTEFFRDQKMFEVLTETVFPGLLKERSPDNPIRVWVAGCSTGEEAYSIAICLREILGDHASVGTGIQVFATDISDQAIAKARSGNYKKNEVKGLSASRLKHFFTLTDGQYRLNRNIRDACVFAFHNFLKDPPFAKMDLVCCRNSLIYMEPVLQKKALTTFHYALREKGFLVLGKSETIAQAADLYMPFDKNNKIYTRKSVRGRFQHVLAERNENRFKENERMDALAEIGKNDFQKSADNVLLSRYTPAGVVVNSDMEIVQFRGATGNWLEASPGKPNLNILKMAREGLAFELRNALHKVKNNRQILVKDNIPMGKDKLVTIEVIPLPDIQEMHYLVLFKNSTIEADHAQKLLDKTTNPLVNSRQTRELLRIKKLQQELAQAREDMRSITEDQEASNEELQSANEELLSGSEELQSLNEELETSKEETQTSNEELIIVNQELYDRNEQLNLSRLYAESIVTTIREPLIILDKDLHVRSANKAFYKAFHTTEEFTEGNLLFDLGNKQWDIPGLRNILLKVIPSQTLITDYEVSHEFPVIGHRIMRLNASAIIRDNSEDHSILLAFEDVTEKRRIQGDLKIVAEQLENQIVERTSSLKEANSDLYNSNKNLEQFAYIASHDLQEPLRKIRTYSSMLQDRYNEQLPEKAKGLVSKISNSAERMTTLIKDVLNFSRVLHGDTGFEKTDLNNVLQNVLVDFDLLITEKKAVINWQKLPVIEAIPIQMNQLFYNLVGNSLKFSKTGVAPVITITSRKLTNKEIKKYKSLNEGPDYCEIECRDNGIGFEEQYANQVFLVFHRLHGRKEFSGTGIGLALCKSIAVIHHGEIFAESVLDNGASFKVILPMTQRR